MPRPRLRDLGIVIGDFPAGECNAITDVSGVTVGHATIKKDSPRVARTGVTVICPRGGKEWLEHVYAGYHSFNGAGEMTGLAWLDEFGTLTAPVGITNTHQVGVVRDAIVEWGHMHGLLETWVAPVVAETFDGGLNDINAFHVTKEHVFEALGAAMGGPVTEGCVGGGTGMNCHGFKSGIGTSSRVAQTPPGRYTVGVLVQANYGQRHHLRVNGVPVGKEIPVEDIPAAKSIFSDVAPKENKGRPDGSIIIVVATDAPLLPIQCKRMARHATVGLAKTGGFGFNGSGDIFLAFATGNAITKHSEKNFEIKGFPNEHLSILFEATAEATEEAILNALCAAEDTTGKDGRLARALPTERLKAIMKKYGR